MDCPGCGVEMIDLAGDDQTLRKCGECGGLWVDVSDLNRTLLHSNLPGLESLGGKVNTEELSGQCPDCQVDLVLVEGGPKNEPLTYQTCESCGGVFLEAQFQEVKDYKSAVKGIVDFFLAFSGKKKKAAG
jgi:Zn-finger nucleic acid-binding protein